MNDEKREIFTSRTSELILNKKNKTNFIRKKLSLDLDEERSVAQFGCYFLVLIMYPCCFNLIRRLIRTDQSNRASIRTDILHLAVVVLAVL